MVQGELRTEEVSRGEKDDQDEAKYLMIGG